MASKLAGEEVEAVLRKRQGASSRPGQEDLLIPYEYIRGTFRSSRNEGSSASATASPHWYCSKCSESLHREVATYLIFLFAYAKSENAQLWLTELEAVLECEGCARGFGVAKRRFRRKYLGSFPDAIINNFFSAVDKWVVSYVERRAPSDSGLDTLPAPLTHLILSEPALLEQATVKAIVDRTKDTGKIASYGLTPMLLRLSEDDRWSLRNCKHRPTSIRSWNDEGVGQEVQALYSGEPGEREWSRVEAVLGALAQDALEQGLLGVKTDQGDGKGGKGLMAALVPRLSGDSPAYNSIFHCFTALLKLCHSQDLWSFDMSPELPHTLFASIKNNPSFIALIEDDDKRGSTLAFLQPYLMSTLESGPSERSPFGETLARMASYTFAEMQHPRLPVAVRVDVAEAGMQAILAAELGIDRASPRFSELSATLDIHATFIANVAFRDADYPGAQWAGVCKTAREYLSICAEDDNKDAMEVFLTLATFANHERQRIAKKSKGLPVEPPSKPAKLAKATVRKAVWDASYNAISPRDAAAIALLMDSVARHAHLDLLDADRSWSTKDLKEMIVPSVWLDSVNSVNVTLKTSREHFAQTIESFSLQPSESLLRELFAIPGAACSAMLLLLSPDDSINEAVLSLIQQAFDVDDRSEAFRTLLRMHPMDSVDALCMALQNFTRLAPQAPELCSLAKRLVRCFYDIVEGLCSSTDGDIPLLSSDTFMDAHRDDTNMRRQIHKLWHSMTVALAVIYKRTPQWAGWFENSVMTEWMRDALILGSQLCDKVRMFESAVLGVTGADPGESPAKVSNSGKGLVAKLHVVLRDLTAWFRLTDVEILYQTFNLIKVILQRTAKANFDVSKSLELQESVVTLSKFVSRPSKSYSSKLSEDKISELSELLAPFSPSIEDEVEFLSSRPARSSPASSPPREVPTKEKKNALEAMMDKARRKGKYVVGERKDAFAEMMKSSQGSASKYKPPAPKPKEPVKEIDVDEFDDEFLDNLSSRDLDIIEKRAKISSTSGAQVGKVPSRPSAPLKATRPAVPTSKLNINVVPRPAQKKGLTTSLAQMKREMRRDFGDRQKIGGITPSIPAASSVGSGLGAYQPPKTVAVQRPDSDTSEDSDSDDGGGMSQLINKSKIPIQVIQAEPIRPKLRYTDDAVHSEMRRRQLEKERHARRQKRLKPDLGPLFRFVLSWDPTSTDAQPPHPDRVKIQLGDAQPIPAAFGQADRYDRVMLPLFLQELWAQSLNDKALEQDIAVEVTSRSYEDDWIDVELAVVGPWPDRLYLNETDVVILSQPGNPKKIFARIQGVKKTFKQANIKVRIVGAMDVPSLIGKNKWLVRKHLSLSTALREFGALRGLPYYEPEMLRDILGGRSAHLPMMNDGEVQRTMSTYDVNEPQAKAIIGSTRIDGFALIQGPPGTGKTKTISGLVGKWLSDRPNPLAMPNNNTAKKQKLLVCAPSNAAIDEVCKRLMIGVPTSSGERKVPFIVRIGIDNSVNDAVKDRSLDNLVEARVSNAGGKGDTTEYGRIQAELEDIKGRIHSVQQQLSVVKNDEKKKELEIESHNLNTKRVQLGKQSSKAKDAARDANRHLDGARRAAKTAILEEADIVCATLSGAGQDILAAHEFETVIIDEAAQAIELACLIPLKYGCKRCIMVGDPNQLPPTTFSTAATKLRYNESLFVRMANRQPQNMHLLSIQYRMHPDISKLPSRLFYNSKLADGPGMADKTAALWHSRNVFGPYRFFDVRGLEERQSTSTKNRKEAQVAVQLYKTLGNDFGDKINLNMRVGIISMYREQIYEMRRAFMSEFGQEILSAVEFNTVDGFQGQEKDIIILSTVRSGPELTSIGFLRDFRRMNVALTRAKSSLFVVGNADTLARCDDMWSTIVGDARERGFLIQHNDSTFKSLAPPPKPSKVEPKPKPVERVPVKRKITPPADLKPLPKKVKQEPIEPPMKSVKRERSSSVSSSSSSSGSEMGLNELAGKKTNPKKAPEAKPPAKPPTGSSAARNGVPPAGARPPPAAVNPHGPARFTPGQRPPPMRPPAGTPLARPPPIVHRTPAEVAAEAAFRTKKKRPINGAVRPPAGVFRPPPGPGPSFRPYQ